MPQANRTPDTRIYIMQHSDKPVVEGHGYHTLHLGRALAAGPIGDTGDDTGDNISRLNSSFCELTGLYWLWRNVNCHILGLVHYRRYFAPRWRPAIQFGDFAVAQASDFNELSEGVDLVIPRAYVWNAQEDIPLNVLTQYARAHHAHDLFLARQEVLSNTPEYRDAFDFVLATHTISHHNMFVGRKMIIDDYCAWLFPVLFTLERKIPYEFYEYPQTRLFGFLAERLFNVWLCHNRGRLRIVERNLVRTEPSIL